MECENEQKNVPFRDFPVELATNWYTQLKRQFFTVPTDKNEITIN